MACMPMPAFFFILYRVAMFLALLVPVVRSQPVVASRPRSAA